MPGSYCFYRKGLEVSCKSTGISERLIIAFIKNKETDTRAGIELVQESVFFVFLSIVGMVF